MKKMYEQPHLLLFEVVEDVLSSSLNDTIVNDGDIKSSSDFI